MIVKLPPTTTARRLPGLDGIRGIAVLWVVLHHYADSHSATMLSKFASVGGYGVSIFFVLSGFLITHLLLKDESRFEGLSLARFYLRRAVRILPVVGSFLVVMLAFDVAGLIDVPFWDYVSSATFWRNFRYPHNETGHLWSLSVEEQFYLVWPALFVLLNDRTARIIVCVIAIAAVRVYWHVLLKGDHAAIDAKSTIINIEPLAVGVLAAVVTYRRSFDRNAVNAAGLCAVALLGVILFVDLSSIRYVQPLLKPLGFACVAAIIYAAAFGKGLITKILEFPPLRFVGLVSYSLYIWQQPWAVGPLSAWPTWAKATCVVGCTLASYFLIERPAHRLNSRFR